MADIHFVRQDEPRGLGHAVGMARHHVGDEPFAVLLPDDLMAEDSTLLADMVDGPRAHRRVGDRAEALRARGDPRLRRASSPPGRRRRTGCVPIAGMVEKPPATEAPSDLAIMGRYVLTPAVFDRIDRARSPAPAASSSSPTPCSALWPRASRSTASCSTSGRYDTGNKLDWLRATVEVALQHDELGKGFRDVLTEIVRREGIG